MENNEEKYAFFTIDVERFTDTECVKNSGQQVNKTMLDGLDEYIGILDKYNIKSTMFVLSDIAEDVYEQLKKHIKNGHKIALHGKEHIAPRLMTNEQFKKHITAAKEKLEKLFKVPVIGYRAPCFSMDREKLNILQEAGFKYDSSRMDFSCARHTTYVDLSDFEKDRGEIYRKNDFYEFGISTQKVLGANFPISGGGYIRISHWPFISTLIKKYLKKSNYYMFYSHPFELSKEKMPKIKKLKFYDKIYLAFGHFTYPKKIEYIIRKLKKAGYRFATIDAVASGNIK